MALAHLRIRVSHLMLALGGLALLITAVLTWRALRSDPEHERQVNEGLEHLRDKPAGTRPPRVARGHSSGAATEARNVGEGVAVFEPPPSADPGDLGPAEAVANFQGVIRELEAAVDSGRRLSPEERAELYNRATGSFTAMSAWVDPNDNREQTLMNDSYTQMLSLMRELDIRPPVHDPDARPFRP